MDKLRSDCQEEPSGSKSRLMQLRLNGDRPQVWRSISFAFISGIVMGCGAAPLNLWGLAWIALVPLWVVILRPRSPLEPWRTTLIHPVLVAMAWSLGYHGFTLAWITGLHPLTWMGVPWLGSVAIALFCWGCITAWGMLQTGLWAILLCGLQIWQRRSPNDSFRLLLAPRLILGTALWCALDGLWGLSPLYWPTLAYTQSPGNRIILHLGQLSGPATITAALVAVNGCLAVMLLAWRSHLMPNHWGRSSLIAALTILLVAHGIGGILYSRPLSDRPDQAVTVGIVQGNIPTRIKLSPEGIRRAVIGYTDGYHQLVDQGADVVLTPEGALPMIWEGRTRHRSSLYQAILQRGVPAWVGTFARDGDRYTQSLLSVTGEGSVVGRYNKIRLVPLGEYIPFQAVLEPLISRLSPIEASMKPGTWTQILHTPVGQAIASICYESAYANLFRRQAAQGGEFILTASNLDPYSSVLMAQHQAHDLMRAIETDRWAVRATNTGYSGFIDPHGQIHWRSPSRAYAIHAETIYRRTTQTLYVRWGNWFTGLLLIIGIAGNRWAGR